MRSPLFVTLIASILAAGCALPAGDPAEPVGAAEEAQLDPGFLSARRFRFTFSDTAHTPFAEIHVLNRPSGARVPGTEYWYVNRASLSLLATTALDVTVENLTVDPPDPEYPNMQSFTEVEFPAGGWGSGFVTDPLSYGKLLGNGTGIYLRIGTSTAGVSRVGWYQVIPTSQSPAWLTPSGHFTGAGSHVIVPTGYRGYAIDQTVP